MSVVHLVNPSDNSFGTAVITPRWLFVLAAEYKNLTRAAEAAGTTQPVVSQRIKQLETRLGRKLLDRSPRIVQLTDAGLSFLDRAKNLLAVHEAALIDPDE